VDTVLFATYPELTIAFFVTRLRPYIASVCGEARHIHNFFEQFTGCEGGGVSNPRLATPNAC